MSIVNDLQALPLFQGISEERLAKLVGAFRPLTQKAGTVLFRPGDTASRFELLTLGEVLVEEERPYAQSVPVKFQLRPLAPLGELGALTGIPRSTTATAITDVELLTIPVGDLLGFFNDHADIGLAFHKNLLTLVGDKVRRDRRRMDEMRWNIIRTQKAMKQMRDTVLDAPETSISKPIFETLDNLINNNRRANYRVTPTTTYPAQVRLDDGRVVRLLEVSEGYVKVEGTTKDIAKDPTFWTGVVVTPREEFLVSGTVIREGEGGVVVKLDTLVDEYKATLDDYITRVQLLDFVV